MGALKRYIAAASTTARVRIIEEQRWCSWRQVNEVGERCLLGVVNGATLVKSNMNVIFEEPLMSEMYVNNFGWMVKMPTNKAGVHCYGIIPGRFNRGYDRWGMRFVALLKKYAAQCNEAEAKIGICEVCGTAAELEYREETGQFVCVGEEA